MTEANIKRRNAYFSRLNNGELLPQEDRGWMAEHPLISSRYGDPWIIADFLPLEPGKSHAVTIQCQHIDPQHPIVPTFTIPFEKGGAIRLEKIVNTGYTPQNMKYSTKLSFRMMPGVTIVARCHSDSGLLMVSYQGWLADLEPMPLWYESVACDRFAMRKEVISENMVLYRCCGADGSEDVFRFLVNWYPTDDEA